MYLPSDASLSRSNEVSSSRADQAAPSSEVDSLPPRGVTLPSGWPPGKAGCGGQS